MSTVSGAGAGHRRLLVGALAGSVVLVVGALLVLGGGRTVAPQTAEAEALPEPGPTGIRAAGFDPVRRAEPEPEPEPPGVVAELSPERQRWLADPPAPIEPDAEAVARFAELTEARPRATRALQEAFDARHDALRRACWKSGEVESASVFVQARFAADGSVLEIDYADDGRSPGLQACVRAQEFAPRIDPPGQELAVRASLTLP